MKCVQDLGGNVLRVSDAQAHQFVVCRTHQFVAKKKWKQQTRELEEKSSALLRKAYDDDLLKRQAAAAAKLGDASKLNPAELRHDAGVRKKAPRVRMKKKRRLFTTAQDDPSFHPDYGKPGFIPK
jgi:hypothetical protein